MVYWKKWKSLIGGGLGFLILGIFMTVLYVIFPGDSLGNKGPAGVWIIYGALFFIIAIVMLGLGFFLSHKPENS